MQKLPLSAYNDVLRQFKERKYNFEVHHTSYTRRMKLIDVGQQIIFSDSLTSPYLIKLIESIRADADEYCHTLNVLVKVTEKDSFDVDFYKFIDTAENSGTIEGFKIDLTEAYWKAAENMSLISGVTEQKFEKFKRSIEDQGKDENWGDNKVKQEIKNGRLKALGSLATRKIVYRYRFGELIEEKQIFETPINKARRQVYITVCDQVAELMKGLLFEFFEHAVYYYWDCIFLKNTISPDEVIRRISEAGYSSKIEGVGSFEIIKDIEYPKLVFKENLVEYPVCTEDLIYDKF